MTTNNRFFLGTLNVTIGEYSNLTRSLVVANSEARAFAVLDRAAASMYGDGEQEENENGYEANGGEICTTVHGLKEVGLAAFLELKDLLSVHLDRNVTYASLTVDPLSTDGFKAFCRSTARGLARKGHTVALSGVQEAVSAALGQKNWQVMRAALDAGLTPAAAPLAETAKDPYAGVLRDWTVSVCRIGYAHSTMTVQASSQAEAEEKALDRAPDELFSEKDAEYEVGGSSPSL